MRSPRTKSLIFLLLVFVFDQITKAWILHLSHTDQLPIRLNSFTNIILAWNKGISFGIFNTWVQWAHQIMLGLILVVTGIVIGLWLRASTKAQLWGWAAVLGGAAGNIIDRFRFGAVVDFIDWHVGTWHWPTFNIADTAISIGVLVILLQHLYHHR